MNKYEIDKIQNLEVEIEGLKNELNRKNEAEQKNIKKKLWYRKRIYNVFLGAGLKKSIKKTLDEVSEKKFKKDTIADLLAHVLWRITRIGFFALFLGLLPSALLTIQAYLVSNQNQILNNQNKKIDIQNRRLEQQTYLQEAERRSSLVFLFNNILDKIDEELKDSIKNPKRELSPHLIGRIISLSEALKPYRFLENDSLITEPLSPERGHLLINLLNSKLSAESLGVILTKSNFSFADLRNINLSKIGMSFSDMVDANFRDITDSNKEVEYSIINANLEGANFSNADLSGCNFKNTNLQSCNFFGAELIGTNFENANLKFSKFENFPDGNFAFCELDGACIEGIFFGYSDVGYFDFKDTWFLELDWLQNLEIQNKSSYDYIMERYDIKLTRADHRGQVDFYTLKEKINH